MAVEGQIPKSPSNILKNTDESVVGEDNTEIEEVDTLLTMIQSEDADLQRSALKSLKDYCQKTTDSMASLPKHLKYMYDKIEPLKKVYHSWSDSYPEKKDLGNIISCLSIMDTENKDCLNYRLNGRQDNIGDWGIEYIRHLAEELRLDFEQRISKNPETGSLVVNDISDITHAIAKFYMKNNCEIDAVDLCGDLDFYEKITGLIDENSLTKICRYLMQSSNFLLREESRELVRKVISFYNDFNYYPEIITACAKILNIQTIGEIMNSCVEKLSPRLNITQAIVMQRQLALMVAHYGLYSELAISIKEENKQIYAISRRYITNQFLSRAHEDLARELDVVKPHTPEDIYRITGHKLTAYYTAGYVSDPPRLNLGSAFVSGLVNASFGMDALLVNDQTNKWLLNHKDSGLMNCIACTGLIYMWNTTDGALYVEKFIDSTSRYAKAGGILALGICYANCQDSHLVPLARVKEYLTHTDSLYRQISNMSLGLAYAGTGNMEVVEELIHALESSTVDFQTKAMASLSLGLIGCGSPNNVEIAKIIVAVLFRLEKHLSLLDPYIRLIPIGIGILFIGYPEKIPSVIKEISKLSGEFGRWCHIILKICSNAGTGNVLAVQKLIKYINEVYKSNAESKHKPTEPEAPDHSADCPLKNNTEEVNVENQKSTEPVNNTNIEGPPVVQDNLSSTKSGTVVYHEDAAASSSKDVPAVAEQKPAVVVTDSVKVKSGSESRKSNTNKREFKKEKDSHHELDLLQGLATLGVAFISTSEEISQKMALRLLSLFLQFGNAGVRRAIPISLGVLFVSNPQVQVIELLSKLSHDVDSVVSSNAIIALGIVSAGTNHSRVANMLRNLGIFYYRDSIHLFAVRLAQGLVHLSKGLMSMSPFRADQTILSPLSLASLIIHGVLSLDVKNSYLTMDAHLFFWLVPSMKLRALITYDEDMNHIPVSVRVGQAIDDTGQAGNPKRITAFQTQRTPILLNAGERAEMASDEYVPYTNILENIVIVRKASELPK